MRFPLRTVLSGAAAAMLLAACSVSPDRDSVAAPADTHREPPHPYVGMWVTADGHIRQELLANGRYDEARGGRQSAYTGSYQVFGTRIEYVDDTGFTADGTFDADVLHHGGYVFYREGSDAHRRHRRG
ncbi:Atu4866 domain-containing protein [Actinoplanes sp. DH11]|uniref:Atu4866 domain-containing protein n=1 Tax=Actinoplanes sp. DH11 TaxID=2857011 RepID=UPI001E58C2AB|nr:Atu4866 domain-containing protein [Actinoplanes sp. DH11]